MHVTHERSGVRNAFLGVQEDFGVAEGPIRKKALELSVVGVVVVEQGHPLAGALIGQDHGFLAQLEKNRGSSDGGRPPYTDSS